MKSKTLPARKRSRLEHYDTSLPGAYFVTLCAQDRICLFGDVVDGKMKLNDAGKMVLDYWSKLPGKFEPVKIDEPAIIPNHVHGIIHIVGATLCGRPGDLLLGDLINWLKTMTTNAYIRGVKQQGWPSFDGKVWQRNYYDHVVRNEKELTAIRVYIEANPVMWSLDKENPAYKAGTHVGVPLHKYEQINNEIEDLLKGARN